MESRKQYLKYYDLDVSIDRKPTEDILKLLQDTVLGTPGGIRYQLKDTAEKVQVIPEIYFLTLRKFNRILGTVGFVRRTFRFGTYQFQSYYLRYFSIRSPIPTSRRKRKAKPDKVRIRKKRNILKEQSEKFMEEAHKYLKTDDGDKTVLYAYIEQENQRSMEMSSRMGYKTMRIMTNEFFSRVFPRSDRNVGRIREDEKETVRKKLREFYRDFTFYTEESLFYKDAYFVYRQDGEIVAGVQATPVEWEIKVMPGISGWIFQKLVPVMPFLKQLFNPNSFRFVSLDFIYYKEGSEKLLLPLFESVLAHQNVRTAITWHDSESPILKTIQTLPRLGIFRKLTSSRPAEIRMKFAGLNPSEEQVFADYPAFIIAFDAT